MTTATATWPTPAELEEVSREIVAVFDRIDDLTRRARRLRDDLDLPDGEWRKALPTLVEFAAFSRFVAGSEVDLSEINTWMEVLRDLRDDAACKVDLTANDA